MNRQGKDQKLELYEESVGIATYAILCDYSKISVNEFDVIRRELAKLGGSMVTMKNTLARIVFERHGIEAISEHLMGPSLLIYGTEEISPVAKQLEKFMRRYKTLTVKAVMYDGAIFPRTQFKTFTTLPTKDEVRAKLLGTLQAPLGNFLRVSSHGQRLVTVLSKYAEKQG